MNAVAPYLGEKHDFATYAEFANIPASMSSPEFKDWRFDEKLSSECMYRVCCLIAFGMNMACFDDIKSFVKLSCTKYDPDPNDFDNEYFVMPPDSLGITVHLPYEQDFIREWAGNNLPLWDSCVGRPPYRVNNKINFKEGLVQGVFLTNLIVREHFDSFDSRAVLVECAILHEGINHEPLENVLYRVDHDEVVRAAIGEIGCAIANGFAHHCMKGYSNARPIFEVQKETDNAWIDLVCLRRKDFPSICPVCGRVVDRRQPKGGRPPETCRPNGAVRHGTTYQNWKTKIAHSESSMFKNDLIAMAARRLRYQMGTTERFLAHPESLLSANAGCLDPAVK